jgi:hypothetical protein
MVLRLFWTMVVELELFWTRNSQNTSEPQASYSMKRKGKLVFAIKYYIADA